MPRAATGPSIDIDVSGTVSDHSHLLDYCKLIWSWACPDRLKVTVEQIDYYFLAIWASPHQIQSSISNSLIGDWDQKYGLVGEGGHVRHYAPKWPDHAINEQQGGGVGRARVRVVPHDVSYWPNLTTSKPPTLLNKSTFWPSFVWRKKTACFVVTTASAGALEESGILTFSPQSCFSCHRKISKSYLKIAVHLAPFSVILRQLVYVREGWLKC